MVFLLFELQLKCDNVIEAKYRKKKWCFIFMFLVMLGMGLRDSGTPSGQLFCLSCASDPWTKFGVQCDVSVGREVCATNPGLVEGENQFLQVILLPPHACCGVSTPQTHQITQTKTNIP